MFFPSPHEEDVAVWWADFLSAFVGEQVSMLRPNTCFSEIFSWVESHSDDPVRFVLAVMEEFSIGEWSLDLHGFLDYLRQMTFREFVEYAAKRQTDVA